MGAPQANLRPVEDLVDASTVTRDALDEQFETVSAEIAPGF